MKRRFAKHESGSWLAFIALAAIFATTSDATYVHLGSLVAIWALWSTSFNLIWGYAGQFSLAQVAFGAVAAYAVAILTVEYGWSFYAAIPVAVTLSLLFSLIVGYFSLRLSGFYFAIMTLAFALIVVRVLQGSELAGRSTGLRANFDLGSIDVGPIHWDLASRDGGFVILAFLLLAVALLFLGRVEASGTGWALQALREDEVLARSMGIEPLRFRLLAFMVSAVIAAFGGIMYAAYLRYISPGFFSFTSVIAMIALVVLGGRGHRFGPLVGSVIYIGITQWLEVGGEWGEGVFGALLILLVLFLPNGVLGIEYDRLVGVWKRRGLDQEDPVGADAEMAATQQAKGVRA